MISSNHFASMKDLLANVQELSDGPARHFLSQCVASHVNILTKFLEGADPYLFLNKSLSKEAFEKVSKSPIFDELKAMRHDFKDIANIFGNLLAKELGIEFSNVANAGPFEDGCSRYDLLFKIKDYEEASTLPTWFLKLDSDSDAAEQVLGIK